MKNATVAFFASLTVACGPATEANSNQTAGSKPDQDFSFTPKEARQYPLVTDSNAPTIAELKARGFDQTGWDAEMVACGPACDDVYAYAIFIGRKKSGGEPHEHLFTCPNPGETIDQDEWKCVRYNGRKVIANG